MYADVKRCVDTAATAARSPAGTMPTRSSGSSSRVRGARTQASATVNTPAAIRALKGCLAHVHISENDRSTPGKGNVRWAENFDTLKEIGDDNLMVIEAFGLALKKLTPATKIWRRMYESEGQLAADGLKFMKAEVAKRWK